MIPDGLINAVWGLGGILLTACLADFINHGFTRFVLWTGFGWVVCAFLALALHFHNSLTSRTSDGGSSHAKSNSNSPFSVNQTMNNSPGGVQNVTINAHKQLINSIELVINFFEQTPARPDTEFGTSVGISVALGLFSRENVRYRFVTDYKWTVHQVNENERALTLVFAPESPVEILGKEISLLTEMDSLVMNMAEFFKTIDFAQSGGLIAISIALRINGIQIFSERGPFSTPGKFNEGQFSIPVRTLFEKVPVTYQSKVSL